jgi:hypothetical protein
MIEFFACVGKQVVLFDYFCDVFLRSGCLCGNLE